MSNIATMREFASPIKIKIPEKLHIATSSGSSPKESTGTIIGIINRERQAPFTQRYILEEIATAKLQKQENQPTSEKTIDTKTTNTPPPSEDTIPKTDEKKPAPPPTEDKNTNNPQKKDKKQSTPPPGKKPEAEQTNTKKKDARPEEQKKTTEQPVDPELVRQTLQELGQELADIKNDNAKNVALALSMGDTPLAREFQEQTARFILRDGRPDAFSEAKWSKLEGRLPPEAADSGLKEFKQFLKDENISPENADNINMVTMIDDMLKRREQKGDKYTSQALRLQRRLGWSDKNPMPINAHDLTKNLGGENNTGTRETNIENMLKKDQVEKQRSLFFQKLKLAKGQIPSALYIMLIGTSFFTQMAQESGQQR